MTQIFMLSWDKNTIGKGQNARWYIAFSPQHFLLNSLLHNRGF